LRPSQRTHRLCPPSKRGQLAEMLWLTRSQTENCLGARVVGAVAPELTIAGDLGAKTDEVNRGLRGDSFLLAYAIDLQSISEREASIHARLMYPS
jgi:hypothetical protein